MASTEVETVDTGWVREDPDAPSARFGWSGTAPRTYAIASFVCGLICFAMLRGNHVGHVEDIWLIAIGIVLVVWPIWALRPRKTWKRA
ncbi:MULTISPECIES: DUF2631 domain-containing protein [unclassified Gordonia (in: high G+C Gram-positive bacteria)]|uniref:DUF2631 domain-containing protein n=1 Tax=unclassified Gordonia (in: high G+C Gram-positive bacteria) TaxID=2657482 RepID=UPI001FFF8F6F|nr:MULTISPECIES: DUF2631 domain-containing protein [unclassified Gordonia (in: high G+C Gram-positive bacteria)]UQE76642.1 DUF2631 domain-containing protein [Gordonia sp. PP30]